MINNYLIPAIVLIIIAYGFINKTDIYENFITGCIEGLKIVITIIPTLLAMIFAINIFINSNVLNVFGGRWREIIPMIILRPISGNATLAILSNIYKIHGVDSFLSFLASTIQGATDTTIYVLALYFGSINIRKTRYALFVGLFADFCGILAAFIVVKYFF